MPARAHGLGRGHHAAIVVAHEHNPTEVIVMQALPCRHDRRDGLQWEDGLLRLMCCGVRLDTGLHRSQVPRLLATIEQAYELRPVTVPVAGGDIVSLSIKFLGRVVQVHSGDFYVEVDEHRLRAFLGVDE